MKKAIILVMSCNQERYINEENIIRKTWGYGILQGKYENLSLFFYRGGHENEIIDNNVLYLKSSDNIDDTSLKTFDSFEMVNRIFKDYDYIIRTNTSTYLNIEAILSFLNMNLKDNMMYGPSLVINEYNKYIPYLSGHCLIFSKYIADKLLENKHKIITGVDDAVFGYILWYVFGNSYMNYMMEFDSILDMNQSYENKLDYSYCIRIKDELNPSNNIIRMNKLHEYYSNKKNSCKIKKPHKFKNIFTCYGKIPI